MRAPQPATDGAVLISYARISADTEGDEHGVTSQHRRNRETAARYGCTIAVEITDNDLSASKADVYREGFEQLVRALALGQLDDGTTIDGAVVVEQSRLARRHTDWERFTDALSLRPGRTYIEAGARLDPYSEDFDLRGDLGTLINKSEAKKIRRRTTASHLDRAQNGIPVGGTRPFGWQPDRRTLNPDEAAWVRRAVDWFLTGRSLGEICRELTRNGVVTPAGNRWTTHALKQMIDNPRICGWRRLRGELITDTTGEHVVGQWEPIIEPRLWLAVDAKLQARRTPGVSQPTARRYLLSGLVRCGRCMNLLRSQPRPATGTYLYVCPPPAQHVSACGRLGRNGERVEQFVVGAFLARFERVRGNRDEPVWSGEEDLAAALLRRERFTVEWQGGRVSDDLYFQTIPELELEIRRLQAARRAHVAALAQDAMIPANVAAEWEQHADDLAWQRSVLFGALHSVILEPVGHGVRRYDESTIRLVWR